jgi:[ribosomal protein S18]-alanine N-acetyltransferase
MLTHVCLSSHMQPAIRRMRESDLDEILFIEKSSFLSPWSRCAFENEMRAVYAFPMVMTQPEPPVIRGYLCFWIVSDECHILNLAVHPVCRRRGIASRLITHLLESCERKRIGNCYLEVRISNRVAKSLYLKFGFREEGCRRQYYSDTGEDALIMRRSIS